MIKRPSTSLSLTILMLTLTSSCAFLNPRVIEVSINSNPDGASIFIDGIEYGKTPKLIDLEPNRNYEAFIKKEGYQTGTVKLESWSSVRGGRGKETRRCIIDTLAVFPIIFRASEAYSIRCRDFKKTEYSINLLPEIRMMPDNKNPSNQNFNNSNFLPWYQPKNGTENSGLEQNQNYFIPQLPGGPQAAPGHANQVINIPGRSSDQNLPGSGQQQPRNNYNNRSPNQYYQGYTDQNQQDQSENKPDNYPQSNFNQPDKSYNSWQ